MDSILPGLPYGEIGVFGVIWLLVFDGVGDVLTKVTLFFRPSPSAIISVDSPFNKCNDFGRLSKELFLSCSNTFVLMVFLNSLLKELKSSSTNSYSHSSFPMKSLVQKDHYCKFLSFYIKYSKPFLFQSKLQLKSYLPISLTAGLQECIPINCFWLETWFSSLLQLVTSLLWFSTQLKFIQIHVTEYYQIIRTK